MTNSLPLDTVIGLVALGSLFVGSFLHRCIDRLALAKSVFWPLRSHCEHCLQPYRLWQSLPIVSYVVSLGRCPSCQRRLSFRWIYLPVLTALLLTALFVFHVVGQGRGLPWSPRTPFSFDKPHYLAFFIYHGLLFCFLIVATFIDLDWMIIPDSVTVPGMYIGIVLGTFWYIELHPVSLWWIPPHPAEVFNLSWDWLFPKGTTVPPWLEPIRRFLHDHWDLNWNRWVGFATGLAGLVAGGFIVWIVRAVCTWAFGREAMGFGDVTLMAMIGCFLGWQTVLLVFFLAPLSAVFVGILSWLTTGKSVLPYGPHLSIGAVVAIFLWRPLWFYSFEFFSAGGSLLLLMAAAMLILLTLIALAVQWIKRFAGRLSGGSAAAEG